MKSIGKLLASRLGDVGLDTAVSLIREYARAHPLRAVALIAVQVVGGLLESVGILALIPVLVVVVAGESDTSRLAETVRATFGAIGIEPNLKAALGILVALALVKLVTKIAIAVIQGRYFVEYMQEMRRRMIVAIVGARAAHVFGQSSGGLANTLGDLISQYDIAIKASFGFLGRLIQIGFYLVTAFFVSWWLTAMALVVSMAIAAILYPTGSIIRRASHEKTSVMNQTIALFVETIQGLKPLKAMGRTPALIQVFQQKLDDFKKVYLREVLAAAFRINAPEAMLVVAVAAALYSTQAGSKQGIVSLAVMLMILARTATELNNLLTRLQQVLGNEGAVTTVRNKLMELSEAEEHRTGRRAPVFENAIRFDDVSLAYGKSVIVSGLNMQFEAHRLHVLTGPSGVGKTSLCDTIIGLLAPGAGRVTIDGVDLNEIDVAGWRNMIGYVPQDPFMFNDTVRSNLSLYDPAISDDDILWALDAAEAREVVKALPAGLNTVLGERGMRTSGGQRQRLSIARALVRRPKLVILDEATAALDGDTERAIAQTLQRLTRHTTIIAISHQSCLPEYAHSIVDMRKGLDGRIVIGSELAAIAG